ncbi:hypothetical protein MKY20_20550 [Cytobacillus sp. FSL W8-0315]|uniref:hypothetical protein n=1 Tax=Cytobacillus sp. FSL W8-0315 TaxID=2921600 RepID=UPI0030FB5BE8
MDTEHKRNFHLYIKKEEKEYVCADCGSYSMGTHKISYTSEFHAEVLLKCKHCGWEWEREITYFD